MVCWGDILLRLLLGLERHQVLQCTDEGFMDQVLKAESLVTWPRRRKR